VVELLGDTMEERNHRMDKTLRKERERGTFDILKNWADKAHPVYGAKRKLVLSIERAGTALFGVTLYSVNLMAYLLTCGEDVTNEEKFDVWTPRRSWYESYPSYFDNSVCAYLCTGEEPWDKVVQQTVEDGYFLKDMSNTTFRPSVQFHTLISATSKWAERWVLYSRNASTCMTCDLCLRFHNRTQRDWRIV